MSRSTFSNKTGTSGTISTALGIICADFPYLSGLVAIVDIRIDPRIDTAAATASGKILLGTIFYEQLSLRDLAIVLAHELLHLFRQTHSRSERHRDPKLINIADDFIINDIIRERLNIFELNTGTVLDIGLNWREFKNALDPLPLKDAATEYSLEEMVVLLGELKRNLLPEKLWRRGISISLPSSQESTTSLGAALAEAGLLPPGSRPAPADIGNRDGFESDILSEEMERRLFPDENPSSLEERAAEIREVIKEAVADGVLTEHLGRLFDHSGRGGPSSVTGLRDMLEGFYRTPWESALQRWFDAVSPGDRSWARPSRRGAFRTDIVLPGRKRDGWILHLVLDTSGSMYSILPAALGAIASFCESNNVEMVHVVQTDTIMQREEYVSPEKLKQNFEIVGLGGNDHDSTFSYLATDPEIESIVFVSDGFFNPPPEPPFEVLWAILGNYRPDFSYGTIVNIDY